MEPQQHPLWESFVEWGDANGVDAVDGHPDDWQTWWECFLAGVVAAGGPSCEYEPA